MEDTYQGHDPVKEMLDQMQLSQGSSQVLPQGDAPMEVGTSGSKFAPTPSPTSGATAATPPSPDTLTRAMVKGVEMLNPGTFDPTGMQAAFTGIMG